MKKSEKTEENLGYLKDMNSGSEISREGASENVGSIPSNRRMRADGVVEGLDVSENISLGLSP